MKPDRTDWIICLTLEVIFEHKTVTSLRINIISLCKNSTSSKEAFYIFHAYENGMVYD